MNIIPIVLDARPAYLADGAAASLLQLPLGAGTLLSHVLSRVEEVTAQAPAVFATFPVDGAYTAAIRALAPRVGAVAAPEQFRARLDMQEPSDWLLLVDPTCFPDRGLDAASLLRHPMADPRWARHLVALGGDADGTRERVDCDGEGRVRRIQRFYDRVTWPFTAGVSCSLVPVSSALLSESLAWTSLAGLRQELAQRGVPSRDLPLEGVPLDLRRERDALALVERFLPAAGHGREQALAGRPEGVHEAARLLGTVVVQPGALVEADATVVGPAVIGAGARVGRGAFVAQSVVGVGAAVPPGAVVRQRVYFGPPRPSPAETTRTPWRPPVPARAPSAGPDDRRRSRLIEAKRLLDTVAAAVGLLLLAPLMLLIAAVIRLESRGPVLFGHLREGRNGRPFRCWKFRTMAVGADALERTLHARSQVDGPQFKLDRDPRITRVGRWLRPSSLDELPQLFNVLLGQMSLVGPRPSPFRENQLCVPWRDGRLSVRPGITGLWQVCRHERGAGDFHQWIHYDLLYVRHFSLAVDARILLATVLTGGGRRHVRLSAILPGRALEEAC